MLSKNLYLLFLIPLFFLSCSKVEDVSRNSPFNECIGKSFITKQDLYIYKFNPKKLSYSICSKDVLTALNDKDFTVVDYVKKGTFFTILNVTIKMNFSDEVYIFGAKFPNFRYLVGTDPIVNISRNPPYTKTWSDPPIFDKEYAEPVPSDGVWWK